MGSTTGVQDTDCTQSKLGIPGGSDGKEAASNAVVDSVSFLEKGKQTSTLHFLGVPRLSQELA